MNRTLILAALLALTAGCGFTTIDPGEVATFTTWGVMEQKAYAPGFYWYNPFSTHVDHVNTQVRVFEMQKLSAATHDVQEIHTDVTVNYVLDGKLAYKFMAEVGPGYKEKVLTPILQDAVKAGTAHFALSEIIQQRAKLRDEITKILQARLAPYYIIVADSGVSLTNFGPSPEFMQAVEKKQIEEQKAMQMAFQVTQATRQAEAVAAQAKGAADAVREAAKGDADALRTKGDAQAQYNEKVSKSLTPILVQKMWIEAWSNGAAVPQVISGEKSGGLFLQMPAPERPARAQKQQARPQQEEKEN